MGTDTFPFVVFTISTFEPIEATVPITCLCPPCANASGARSTTTANKIKRAFIIETPPLVTFEKPLFLLFFFHFHRIDRIHGLHLLQFLRRDRGKVPDKV